MMTCPWDPFCFFFFLPVDKIARIQCIETIYAFFTIETKKKKLFGDYSLLLISNISPVA